MKCFWDLQVWQEAHKLTLMIYKETEQWPTSERFRLIDQICRSASAVGANIAEGHGRFNDREFHHFCNVARGSLTETQNHLILARDLGYLPGDRWRPLHEQTLSALRLLHGFMKTLRTS